MSQSRMCYIISGLIPLCMPNSAHKLETTVSLSIGAAPHWTALSQKGVANVPSKLTICIPGACSMAEVLQKCHVFGQVTQCHIMGM